MTVSIGQASRNLALDGACDAANNGYLRIYSGTAPANADTSLSGNTLLAELRMNATAFTAASGASKTANAIAQANAAAAGTATFFRIFKSDGTTVVAQGTVGTSGADLTLSTTTIVANNSVTVTSLVVTFAA